MNILEYDKISVKLIEIVWHKAYKQMHFNLNELLADEIAEKIHFNIHDKIGSKTRDLLRSEMQIKFIINEKHFSRFEY